MQTKWMLLAHYEGLPLIPIETVCRDFFAPLTLPRLLRKIEDGTVPLPIVKLERSQKGAKLVHLTDLAAFLDDRHAEALADFNRLHR